jgi:Flp pilus assembly protein TadG
MLMGKPMTPQIISSDSIAERADRFGLLKVGRRIRSFRKEKRGVAALEFALIAPFMIALWLGSAELSQGFTIDRKVSQASSVLADLVTQQSNITGAEMNDFMDATMAIMMPYNVNNLSIEIAGVSIDNDGATRVEWSETRNGSAAAVGGQYAVPQALALPNSFLVVAQLSYEHTPATAHVISGSITLSDSFFLRPRRLDAITYNR